MSSLPFSSEGLLLPQSGPYELTLTEIERHFGWGGHARRNLLDGLKAATTNLMAGGVTRIILGGSFVSRKIDPRDVDMAWWFNPDIDWAVIDPVFQVAERRAARGKYCVDQVIDGVREQPYEQSHEYFLRFNKRMPAGYQKVGIVRVMP